MIDDSEHMTYVAKSSNSDDRFVVFEEMMEEAKKTIKALKDGKKYRFSITLGVKEIY